MYRNDDFTMLPGQRAQFSTDAVTSRSEVRRTTHCTESAMVSKARTMNHLYFPPRHQYRFKTWPCEIVDIGCVVLLLEPDPDNASSTSADWPERCSKAGFCYEPIIR